MLSEMREVRAKVTPPSPTAADSLLVEDLYVWARDFVREVPTVFDYRGKRVVIKGIPEDFKITLNGELVCEYVYDNVYNENLRLVKEIMDSPQA